jgi:hypothetical protein
VICINKLYRCASEHFGIICKCAECGDVAFRCAASVACEDLFLWGLFCEHFAGKGGSICNFLGFLHDFVVCRNLSKLFVLLNELCRIMAPKVKLNSNDFGDFIGGILGRVRIYRRENLIIFAVILCRVHPYSPSIFPVVEGLVNKLPNDALDLVIRFLWSGWGDPDPDFLAFRLKLMAARIAKGRAPTYWKDELLRAL